MSNATHILPALVLLALVGCGEKQETTMGSFMLRSTAFDDGQAIPREYGCEGTDSAPPLGWSDPPQGTKSFALVVDDPDAPSGTFRHWGAWNIPAGSHGIEPSQAGQFPQAVNDFGKQGYGGPCPPPGHGVHRYRFKLFALDTDKLELAPGAKVGEVEKAAADHLLGRAELTGTYERT
jgi:Raf kinase inhibitor-like YbhB/YbcL family protein